MYVPHLFTIESSVVISWDTTPCSFVEVADISEERTLPASESKCKPSKQQKVYAAGTGLCVLGLVVDPEDGGSSFHRNIGKLLPEYVAAHPTTLYSLYLPL
jgi:hypothetical protein